MDGADTDGTPLPPPARLTLGQRHTLRDVTAYAVETPEGEIGFVTEVRIPPFEYWPDELVVQAPGGPALRVPTADVTEVVPREARILVATTPAGARPVPSPPPASRPAATIWWRLAAAVGAVLGLGGFAATFAAIVHDDGVVWGPGLAASGALGGAASAAAWRAHGRSWLAAIGLGSFWLPLAAGAILSLVLIFR